MFQAMYDSITTLDRDCVTMIIIVFNSIHEKVIALIVVGHGTYYIIDFEYSSYIKH